MCGIAGCVDHNGKVNTEKFEKMVDVIAYRGPDDRGIFYENKLALGHRRLAIIDPSSDGHQPFFWEDQVIAVYNGEIYNYIELREILKKEGYHFKTKTDTEVLVAAYSFWGERCVNYFNGMWSFAIYDRKEQKIFCSRDRFGVKPFYYTEQDGMFLFASEIKQFFEMLQQNPKVNREALLKFIIYGDIDYSEETMFRNIYQLRGGYNLIYDLKRNKYEINQYYDIENIQETQNNYKESCKRFKNIFEKAINIRLRSDVPVGYCLSGGLDSSAIVCMADKILTERGDKSEQHTISSCFEDKRYDEQEYIDEVVRQTSVISHKVFPKGDNLFEQLDEIIWHMDEPFGSTSIYAQWNVFRAAKDAHLKVMLDGQGADEQLAGYTPFYKVMFAECLRRGQIKRFMNEWRRYKTNRARTEKYKSSTKLLLSAIFSMFFSDKSKRWGKMIYFYFVQNKQPFSKEQIYSVLKKENVHPITNTRAYIAESMRNGMAALLHYEDRDSMAHSIESRVPFLDINLAETLFAMPFDHKLREGITKSVLRDGLKGILPEKIRNRYSKLGFVTPEDQWINDNFNKFGMELEESANILSGVLDKKKVMKWFNANKGKMKRGNFIVWRIICAGHWMKVFHVEI